ncbi:hypothetical protein M513_02360 [Trichuris suis]|uniref:Integrase catalytic domain-containing protein n=1 Tax=Trichuris suis TaxID=68888 RepID=A0A085MHI8_9BILA|nr:hypothetical protein M513_02360 [Trichuris suis]
MLSMGDLLWAGGLKWAEAYSCSTMEAEETAELLVTQFFAKFVPPDTIHSDQGSTFEASLMGNLFELFPRDLRFLKTFRISLKTVPEENRKLRRNKTTDNKHREHCLHLSGDWSPMISLLLVHLRLHCFASCVSKGSPQTRSRFQAIMFSRCAVAMRDASMGTSSCSVDIRLSKTNFRSIVRLQLHALSGVPFH